MLVNFTIYLRIGVFALSEELLGTQEGMVDDAGSVDVLRFLCIAVLLLHELGLLQALHRCELALAVVIDVLELVVDVISLDSPRYRTVLLTISNPNILNCCVGSSFCCLNRSSVMTSVSLRAGCRHAYIIPTIQIPATVFNWLHSPYDS